MTQSRNTRDQRRKERANVQNRLQGVHLKCEALSLKQLRVVNISELGLGVETDPIARSTDPTQVIEGKLLVGRTVAPVQLRMVHMTPQMTGLEFVQPSDLFMGVVRQVFEAELVGASLKRVDGPSEQRQVFASAFGDRLEIQVQGGAQVAGFTFQVLGNSIEWNQKDGIRMVQNTRPEPIQDFLRKQLVKLVQSADRIDPGIRRQIENALLGAGDAN